VLNADPPAVCDSAVIDALERACQPQGASYRMMISRAYHDSLFMSLIAPVAMLFIPCRGGVSHRPDEYSSPEAIAKGALVLAEALQGLAA
jgi:N-carbamoyl-L-amino-acid hydrolase